MTSAIVREYDRRRQQFEQDPARREQAAQETELVSFVNAQIDGAKAVIRAPRKQALGRLA